MGISRALMAGEAAFKPILEPRPCPWMNSQQKIVAAAIAYRLFEQSSSAAVSWALCAAETSGLGSQFRMTSVKLWREVHRRVQWWCDAKEPCKGPQRENR